MRVAMLGACKQTPPTQTCNHICSAEAPALKGFQWDPTRPRTEMHIRPRATPTLSELLSNKASNEAYEIQQKSYKNLFYRNP